MSALGWLRVLVAADVLCALLAWALVVVAMHTIAWDGIDHHSWGEYARATALVAGVPLGVIAAARAGAERLLRHGWTGAALVLAASPALAYALAARLGAFR